ncbi:hypothetical protein [Aureibaculum luteum]|uniref:hypothetical protein n=1 Tax=Aureibaculum luteum TaxID=1548456 RepID=UPI000E4F7AA3|nr:hypothetical protein [Aureibaculum luteum]
MKKLIIVLGCILFASNVFSQSFVSPINFVENEINKHKVISFINKQVKDDYSAIGMDDPSTLRMMEKENLKAFKKLTEATNSSLLKTVIKTYCEIGMCNYSTILMMYNEQNKASKKTLKW